MARARFTFHCEREDDGGRPADPRTLTYGRSANTSMAKAEVLAQRVPAERLELGETRPQA